MFSLEKKGNHPGYLKFTAAPTKAWEVAKQSQIFNKVTLASENQAKADGDVRVVCMSDTHNLTNRSGPLSQVPNGDIYIHAGDFTCLGKMREVVSFNDFLATLNHTVKIVIAGNHDIGLHESTSKRLHYQNGFVPAAKIKAVLKDCIYLEDESVEVMGLKIYGSPWTPVFRDWAFLKQRGDEINRVWEKIPTDTDILVTHGPPLGRGDKCYPDGIRAGCANLLNIVQNHVKPRSSGCKLDVTHVLWGRPQMVTWINARQFNLPGETPLPAIGYGWSSDGVTTFINASSCNVYYQPVNKPVIFDIPVKDKVGGGI